MRASSRIPFPMWRRRKKGMWIFFEYDAEHRHYNSFFQFSTAGELEQIIAEVLADEINILIETTTENIQFGLQKFDINNAAQSCYEINIPKLLKNMEILNRKLQKSVGRMDVILRSMLGILCGLKGEG